MVLRQIFLAVCGFSSGVLVSAGVFTVLLAVGLVPRFAGKTHTGRKIFLYEEMVVLGTLAGNLCSVFERFWYVQDAAGTVERLLGNVFLAVFGLFAGVFVGCLAMAIAEMLDSIPIFTRRIGFRHGLGFMVLSTALGKMTGSILYFLLDFYKIPM